MRLILFHEFCASLQSLNAPELLVIRASPSLGVRSGPSCLLRHGGWSEFYGDRPFAASQFLFAVVVVVAGCAERPIGNLIEVSARDPDASSVDMLVATTRAPVNEPAGVMFSGESARGLRFADIEISIPPDSARQVGEIQWPANAAGRSCP